MRRRRGGEGGGRAINYSWTFQLSFAGAKSTWPGLLFPPRSNHRVMNHFSIFSYENENENDDDDVVPSPTLLYFTFDSRHLFSLQNSELFIRKDFFKCHLQKPQAKTLRLASTFFPLPPSAAANIILIPFLPTSFKCSC